VLEPCVSGEFMCGLNDERDLSWRREWTDVGGGPVDAVDE